MLRRKRSEENQGQRGFTLAEVLVSLIVFTQVILISLLLFDFNNRVTRTQTRVAEMQQSLRVGHGEVVRMVRMAGRSGLPTTAPTGDPDASSYPPASVAVSVINNVTGDARKVIPSYDDTPMALAGTDILVIRGNFSGPFFRARLESLDGSRADATSGRIVVEQNAAVINANTSFNFPLPENDLATVIQDLSVLREANDPTLRGADAADTIPEALLLIPSTPGVAYAVLELVPAAANNTSATEVELAFNISGSGDELADSYRALWTNDTAELFPLDPGSGCYVAILEEYRFYVRNDGGARAETARPRLSRARLLPGADLPYGNPDSEPDDLVLRTDIADQILDLQVSVGLDTANLGQINRGDLGTIAEADNGADDDWLYNGAGDDPAAANFTVFNPDDVPRLYFVRINTLARTAGPGPESSEPLLTRLEDRTYAAAEPLVNSDMARRYRRRALQTIVDLRNL